MAPNSTLNNIAVRVLIPEYLYSSIEQFQKDHLYPEFNDALRYILKHFFSSTTSEVPEVCFSFYTDNIKMVKLHINSNVHNSIRSYIKRYPKVPDEKRLITAIVNFFFIIHKQTNQNGKHRKENHDGGASK
jgi:hypothetical protein